MNIQKNNEINVELWQQLVNESPNASFFQTKECYDFYCSLSFMKPFLLGVEENNKLVALVCGYVIADGNIVKQFFSRRAIVPGGPIFSQDCSENAVYLLLSALQKELKSKAIYIEFRNYSDYNLHKLHFEQAGFIYQPHLNFHVKTLSVEQSLKNLSTGKRRDVKLTLKEGVIVADTKEKADVEAYFNLLSELYQTRIKTPLFPLEFFKKIVALPLAHLFAIKRNDELIGGSLCVALDGKILFEWFVCGKDGQFKNIYPSTLATWAAIEYASANEFLYFDMMGAGKPEEGYGVRDFKAKFGGELIEHGRFLYLCNPLLFKVGKRMIERIKKHKK
ncbi:MAG: GNAT family N-acetyltransferase [Porphyromonadaceae bacterium CG2_30_38_12]|nr:MAG: GNAT family N-acetyltransferase [Porphyromonadaceae bacterium CG2_30_38_12]